MNPIAFKTTIDEIYRLLLDWDGDIIEFMQDPAIKELYAIVESQKEMALAYFVDRRVERELVIAEATGRMEWHKGQIEALKSSIEHEESVIATTDKNLILLIESIPDAKTGLPSSKVVINGQTVKVTGGNPSTSLVVDDIKLIPETFVKCTITFPKDRLQYIKMVLDDDEIRNIKEVPDVAGMKATNTVYQGTHYETKMNDKKIKRMG